MMDPASAVRGETAIAYGRLPGLEGLGQACNHDQANEESESFAHGILYGIRLEEA